MQLPVTNEDVLSLLRQRDSNVCVTVQRIQLLAINFGELANR